MKLREERTYPARRPAPTPRGEARWAAVCDVGERQMALLRRLAPIVEEHIRRGGIRLVARRDGDVGGLAVGDHSDPTYAALAERWDMGVASEWTPAHASSREHPVAVRDTPGGRRAVLVPLEREGGPHEEERGADALRMAAHALRMLDRAMSDLAGDYRAVASALIEGHAASDGRTHEEREAARRGARLARLGTCMVDDEPAQRIISGFCEACYRAWVRAGMPDRSAWIVQRRRKLEARRSQDAEINALRTEWDPSRHASTGPADGTDRRVA